MPTTQYSTETRHGLAKEIAKYSISLCVIAIGVGGFYFLNSLASPPETQSSTALIQQVDVAQVQHYSGLLDMVVSGSVVPHHEIKIAAEVAGRIKKKFPACEAGNYVKKGAPLLAIDDEEYQLEIKTTEADVLQAIKRIEENLQQISGEEKNIELAASDLELQQREFDRYLRLNGVISETDLEQSQRARSAARSVISKTELEQSQRALNAARIQLITRENSLATLKTSTERLRAALEFSNRQLDQAKLNLRRTTIVAPDDGVIVREIVQEGDYVAKGTQIVTFEDTREAEILCNLTPTDLRWIRDNSSKDAELIENDSLSVYRIPKTDVTIFDADDPTVTWRGTLERFDGIGRDEVTKTIPCRIAVPEPIVQTPDGPRVLVRGMYVKCRVEVQTTSSDADAALLSFPAVALHPNDHIWIVKNDQLHRVDVEVIDRTETMVNGETKPIVIAKTENDMLRPGDSIVVSPLSQPLDGATVVLKNP